MKRLSERALLQAFMKNVDSENNLMSTLATLIRSVHLGVSPLPRTATTTEPALADRKDSGTQEIMVADWGRSPTNQGKAAASGPTSLAAISMKGPSSGFCKQRGDVALLIAFQQVFVCLLVEFQVL